MAKNRKRRMLKEEQILLKRESELEYISDRLGPGSLMTMQSHTNASRMIMANHNFPQRVSIRNPEAPLVMMGFENKLATFNDMDEQVDGDFKVVHKIEKNDFVYLLIGYDEKRKLYTAWKRMPLEEHSEGFATRFNNKYIDSLEIGDMVPSGTYIQQSESFDKHRNYRYGKNLNTVFLASVLVYEDAVTLMNGAENMMDAVRSFTVTIPLSDNEVLLNLYGDDKHYQGLPYVGEKTYNGYLAAIRQIDGAKAPYALKKSRLRHIDRGDRKYHVSGRVYDIDIRYNGPRSKMIESVTNEQIIELYDIQQAYYHEVYQYMQNIIDHAGLEGYQYTDQFSIICAEAFDYIDASAYFADNNDRIFGNVQITVRVMEDEPIIIGSKLVGRYGDKGVVTEIFPPEKSWKMEDGTPIHAVIAALGIVGRLNQARLNEHSANEIASTAVEMMKQTNDVNKKCKIVHELLTYFNSDEADAFKKFYKGKDDEAKAKLCKRIERDGITIFQHPIDNCDITDIEKAYDHYHPKYQRIVYPDGTRSLNKVICAKMFYIRMKQDPVEKYSARYLGPINPLYLTPTKSNRKKKHLDAVSDVAVRFGEQEMEVLLTMVNHPAAIADFMAENSTSFEAKVQLALKNYLHQTSDEIEIPIHLIGDIMLNSDMDEGEMEEYLSEYATLAATSYESPWTLGSSKKNTELIWAYMNELCSRIEIETETAPDGEWFED